MFEEIEENEVMSEERRAGQSTSEISGGAAMAVKEVDRKRIEFEVKKKMLLSIKGLNGNHAKGVYNGYVYQPPQGRGYWQPPEGRGRGRGQPAVGRD